MNSKVRLIVVAESGAATEVNSVLLRDKLSRLKGVSLDDSVRRDGELIARVTGIEILATFVSSAAAVTLARAIRDLVRRQKIKILVETDDGQRTTVEASGGNTGSVVDIVGFLTHQYTKSVSAETPRLGPNKIGAKALKNAKAPKKRIVKKEGG